MEYYQYVFILVSIAFIITVKSRIKPWITATIFTLTLATTYVCFDTWAMNYSYKKTIPLSYIFLNNESVWNIIIIASVLFTIISLTGAISLCKGEKS